jgi:hypothetical protein
LTVTAPTLHVPDEPVVLAETWLDRVLDGADLAQVLSAEDGLAAWLWQRWRALAGAGVSEDAFVAVVVEYRRELWLWLAGERTWTQACSGLVGRVSRRLAQVAATGA